MKLKIKAVEQEVDAAEGIVHSPAANSSVP